MKQSFSRKEMENAVMLAADLYRRFYNAPTTPGGPLEVAGVVIDEAVKMERWLTKKYGPDDDCYLDRLEEYEAMLVKEHDLPEDDDKGYFVITRVHRDDLEAAGFDASDVDDATMERLADKMADDYVTQLFWDHLPIMAKDLGIPQKEGGDEDEAE